MNLLILNAKVSDNRSAFHNKLCDILIQDGIIKDIQSSGKNFFAPIQSKIEVYDAAKGLLSPVFVDLRADFAEPGNEDRETLESGSNAAIRGGFGYVGLLPSAVPAPISRAGISALMASQNKLPITILPYGCISIDREGKELAELFDMFQAGAAAFTDADQPVHHAGLLLRALMYSNIFKGLVMSRPEEESLSKGGKMHEGEVSTFLGMKGFPALSEEIRVQRDLELAKYAGSAIHFSCISTKGSVDLIRKAKKAGLRVSCDVAIANLAFTDEQLIGYDSNFKVLPPLRSKNHQKALWEAVADGTIDAIVSNHKPRTVEEKVLEFDYALHGMSTLETVLPLLIHSKPANIEWESILPAISWRALAVLNRDLPALAVGQKPEFTIYSHNDNWKYQNPLSKSRNSPLLGKDLKGKVRAVVLKNKIQQIN